MMDLKNQNVLFFSRTMGMGGTSNVMIQMCKILKPRVNKIVVCSTGGTMVETLEKMGIEHVQIDDVGTHTFKTSFNILKQVSHIIKEYKITVVHTHHRMAAFYAAVLKKKYKFIFINTSHNTFYNYKFITRFAYKKANLIACGEMVKKNLVNCFGIPEHKVTVVHNAIEKFDGKVETISELKKMKDDGYYLVANVGRFAEQKGMEYFIEAAEVINKNNQKIKYYIIGSGEKEKDLKQMVQKKKLEDYIKFMGFRADVQNIMSQSDLIVLSSLWEGLPLTPIEAFSVGKTIVATSVDGTVEIVKNKENGLLVKPRDVNELSSAICELVENESEKKKFEENAIKTYKEKFSFEIFRENYIKFYKNIKDE